MALLWLLNSWEYCMSMHSCSYVIIVPWNNIQKRLLLSIFSMQRRLWWVWTFAQAHLSLRYSTEISCTDSNSDLCTVYKNSECCSEAVPETMAHLGNHQCVVSMRQKCSQFVVIKFLNKTLASLPRKKMVIVFWTLLHVNLLTSVLRHAYSPHFRQFY